MTLHGLVGLAVMLIFFARSGNTRTSHMGCGSKYWEYSIHKERHYGLTRNWATKERS